MRGCRKIRSACSGLLLIFSLNFVYAGWQQSNGLGTGRILSVASNNSTVFAGLVNGGIFRSDDVGENWIACSEGLPERTTITALCIAGDVIFAGTEHRLYYSDNNGKDWFEAGTELEERHITALAVSNDAVIYVGTRLRGLYRSDDGGITWSQKNNGLIDSSVQSIDIFGSNLYIGTQNCLYRSVDRAENWQVLKKNSSMYFRAAVEVNGAIYAGTCPIVSVGSLGITCSEDEGENWASADNAVKYKLVRDIITDGSVLLAATWGEGVYHSENGGASWQPFTTGLTCSEVNQFSVSGNTFYAATDGGVFRWTVGEEGWSLKSNGVTKLCVRAVKGSGSIVYAGTERDGVFFSVDNGEKWFQMADGLASDRIYSIEVNDQAVFAGTDSMGVFRRSLDGTSWGAVGSALPALPVVDLTAVGTTIFAENTLTIYRSNDNGDQWNLYKNDLPDGAGTAFVFKGGILYTGSDKGVYKSTDNGASWTASNHGMEDVPIISMAVAGNTLYAGTFLKGVYRSVDNGESWEAVTPEWSYSIEELVPVGSNIFGLSSTNVFVSSDNGGTWENVHTGISGIGTGQFVSLGANNQTLFVGTKFDGIWHRPLSDMVSIDKNRIIPDHASVTVVPPSSRNGNITVLFTLTRMQSVEVAVYTVGGRLITLLADRHFTAGTHTLNFKATGCAPGCYLVKVKTGDMVKNRKITLIR
jgi:hypothetical protein